MSGRSGQAEEVLAAATLYTRRGLAVVPVPYKAKGPVMTGWPALRFAEADLPAHFNGRGNIGVLLGEPSGWLIDVDLDADDAVALATEYLPVTGAVTGREGRPNSHRWYVCPGVATRRFRDPVAEEVIVEIRAGGCQSLVGPSVHPDGGVYDMLDGEPAVVDAGELKEAVAALFEAVIRERHGDLAASLSHDPAWLTDTAQGCTRQVSADEAERRAIKYLDAMPPSISGEGGHDRAYAAAVVLVHGFELQPERALELLMQYFNTRCEPPWSEKELRHKIEDAATKPHSEPKGWLLNAGSAKGRSAPLPTPEGWRPLTDLGNAERLAHWYGDGLRYCAETGKWLTWEGARWREDGLSIPLRRAGDMARRMAAEAEEIDDEEVRDDTLRWAHKCESRGRMGDYAAPAPPCLLTATRYQEHPTEIADLRGRRLVIASEIEEGASLKIAMVKRLTGDEVLKGRFMRADYFSFPRTHKTIMVTNPRPRVREQSHAVWRRIRLVPFNVVIPKEECDPGLLDKLRGEHPGILAWLVRGCLDWQQHGLGEPQAVLAATERYRVAEDVVGRFLADCCEVDLEETSQLFTPWAQLASAFEEWAKRNGEAPMEPATLQTALDRRGFATATRRHDGKPAKGRPGVRLLAQPRDMEGE